jgi:hypothetical protein
MQESLLMNQQPLLNPSCSELVTYLGITEVDEIRQVLKDICTRYFYRVKLIPTDYDILHQPGVVVDIDKLDVNKDVKVLTFSGLHIDPNASNLEKARDERLISAQYYTEHKDDMEKLRTLVGFLSNKYIEDIQSLKLVLMDKLNSFVDIQYQLCPGYDETPGLSLQASQHSAYNEYPLLSNVYFTNPDQYKYMTFGEAQNDDFEKWLYLQQNKNPDQARDWLEKQQQKNFSVEDFGFENQ